MPTEDYPSNSKGSQKREREEATPEKSVERVIESEVKRRKKPLGKRFTEHFISGSADSAWSFVAHEVLIPAARDMIADAFSQGIEKMVYGDARSASRRSGGYSGRGPKMSYKRYHTRDRERGRPDNRGRRELSRRARATHDFDEIVLETRLEADHVLERLDDLVGKYETASVSDLYSLIGVTASYTDDKYGWYDLRDARVERVRGGYLLDLPAPEPLD